MSFPLLADDIADSSNPPVYAWLRKRATCVSLRGLTLAALPGTVGGLLAGISAWWVGSQIAIPLPATLAGGVTGVLVYVVVTLPWGRALLGQVRSTFGGRAASPQPSAETPTALVRGSLRRPASSTAGPNA